MANGAAPDPLPEDDALVWLFAQAGERLQGVRAFFDPAPYGVAVVDVDEIVLMASQALERLFQLDPDALVGGSIDKLLAEVAHRAEQAERGPKSPNASGHRRKSP